MEIDTSVEDRIGVLAYTALIELWRSDAITDAIHKGVYGRVRIPLRDMELDWRGRWLERGEQGHLKETWEKNDET